jgi:hypothetical protein
MNASVEILKKKRDQLQELLKIIDQDPDKKKQFEYITCGLSKLIDWIIDNDQMELNDPCMSSDDIYVTDKVVRYHGYLDSVKAQMHGVDYILCSGIFMVVPLYVLPAKLVEEANEDRKVISINHPTKYGLPSNDLVNYATIKAIDGNKYVALAKIPGSYYNEIIYTAKRYDPIYLL